jgi:Pentapeptide repeats (8 copies)
MKGLKNLLAMILDRPVAIALGVLIIFAVLVASVSSRLGFYTGDGSRGFWLNILAGAHNSLAELLVVGIIIHWMNTRIERRIENRRYLDEIVDYSTFRSQESVIRKQRAIKRLNDNGECRFKLAGHYLVGIDLAGADLRGSDLSKVNMSGAILEGADLTGADLREADLEDANFKDAILDGANLQWSNLKGADLRGAHLLGANLEGARVTNAKWNAGVKFDRQTIPPFHNFRLPER